MNFLKISLYGDFNDNVFVKEGGFLMGRRLKILVLIKPFWRFPNHQPKMDMIKALEEYADVYYWYRNGHIQNILKQLKIKPDFIFHYDISWNYSLAPNVHGLEDIDILKGCYVIDLHWEPEQRIKYFKKNKIDLIFSATKNPFLNVFPQFKEKMSWLPWAINPKVMKDWRLEKSIDYLLMGLTYVDEKNRGEFSLPEKIPPKGRYTFRDTVFEKMKNEPGFMFHPHPGHRTSNPKELFVNARYAKELNQSKMFFTCGSRSNTGGVAVLKFFEAPACKTLLLAERNKDIDDLGFKDEENYVACTTENFLKRARYYLKYPKERNRITENGYKFIHQNHTNQHRAKQLIREIEMSIK